MAGISGALQSPNRANNLRFTYLPTGFQAQARSVEDTDLWSAGIFPYGASKEKDLRRIHTPFWLRKKSKL